MKRTIRTSVFETNSSSVHAFVVFDDDSVLEEWQENPDAFLDLRYAFWTSNHEVDYWTEFDESKVEEITRDSLIYRGSPEYEQACREWKEEDAAYAHALGYDVEDEEDDRELRDEELTTFHVIAYHTLFGDLCEGWWDPNGADYGYGTDAEGHVDAVGGRPLHTIATYE